tara:strand:- start:66 stop:347 length:282 start_codon:yes stop_codon:yes gene_type:complete
MICTNFLSREDRRQLLACVKLQRKDHGVARRANALLLLDDGKSLSRLRRYFTLMMTRCVAGTNNIWLMAGMHWYFVVKALLGSSTSIKISAKK